jgi:hypothetical protein
VHSLGLLVVEAMKVETSITGQVGDEVGVLGIGAGEVPALGGAGMAGRKGRDQHDAAALVVEVVDEIGPEVATGLDGEDEVLREVVWG